MKSKVKFFLSSLLTFGLVVFVDYLLGGNGDLFGVAMAAVAGVTVADGVDGAGKHVTGDGGLTTSVTREESPGLLKDLFDDEVVKMGFSSAPINAMTRDMGYRRIKSMEYGYYSVDLRVVEDAVKTQLEVGATENRETPERKTLTVYNPGVFDKTDQIMFSGISGYSEKGTELPQVYLCARVCEVGSTDITVQFLNPNPAGVTIPVDTPIFILGHAASETDASTVPYSALPTRKKQYMQKFMVQSLISNVQLESQKEVRWDESDINELLMQQFSEDIEKSYIFGVKSYTYDAVTRLYTYTTSGIIEQLVEGGGHVIEVNRSDFNDEKVIDITSEIFVGNSGSNTRYIYMGNDFACQLFKLPNITKYQNVNDTVRKFEFDFKRIRLMSYILLGISHPLLDKMKMGNYAIVLDRQYIQRRVFRSIEETMLKMKETGLYDGKSTVWSEISSVILKYPQCHALIKLVDD